MADGIPPEPEVAAEFLADVQGEDPPVNVQSQVQVHQRAPKYVLYFLYIIFVASFHYTVLYFISIEFLFLWGTGLRTGQLK